MSDYSILPIFFAFFSFFFSISRWLSSEKGDCGTSINLKVVPQHSGDKRHSNNQHQQLNTPTPTHLSSLSIDPTKTLRHTPALLPPILNFSTPQAISKNQPYNTPQHTAEAIRPHGVTFEHERDHGIAGGGCRDKSVDDYDGDNFESDSEVEEGGSEVESEGEGQSSFRGGERSDAEADRHDNTFSDTQEMDSSITNQYLRQLRYNSYVTHVAFNFSDRLKVIRWGPTLDGKAMQSPCVIAQVAKLGERKF